MIEFFEISSEIIRGIFEMIRESRILQTLLFWVVGMNFIMFLMWSNGPLRYALWRILNPIWYFEEQIFKVIFYIIVSVFCICLLLWILPPVLSVISSLIGAYDDWDRRRKGIQLENERIAAQEKERFGRDKREAEERAAFDALPDEEKNKILELESEQERRREAERKAAEKAYLENLRAIWAKRDAEEAAKRAEEEAVERKRNNPDRVRARAIDSIIGRRS